jgi:RNA recognition motif-containing protein
MSRIYVGNLSYQTTEAELRSLFERHGSVASVNVMTDRTTGRPRGFAFVTMRKLDDADEAIARLNGSSLQGRNLVVNEAQARPERVPPVANRWHLV